MEIIDGAADVRTHPFSEAHTGGSAFFMGNEGDGLHQREIDVCDSFVYIPHHGGGTASLNVTVAASIIFHQFSAWARYPERTRDTAKGREMKYLVAEIKQKTGEGDLDEHDLQVRAQRKAKREQIAAAQDALGAGLSIFGE